MDIAVPQCNAQSKEQLFMAAKHSDKFQKVVTQNYNLQKKKN